MNKKLWFESEGDERLTTTLGDLASNFDELLRIPDLGSAADPLAPTAKGFVIGTSGRTLFWFIDPTPNGFYKCYPEHPTLGTIRPARYYDATITKITIIYPKPKK